MTWAWLTSSELDFGVADRAEVDGERTVWLYADPHRVLSVRPSADLSEVQRAYRRVARLHHPDLNPGDAAAFERFHDVQHAYEAAVGEPEVAVEPISGDWWTFTGFDSPALSPDPSLAVTGLRFEIHDLHRVPKSDARDEVRISYAGQALPLAISYSGSRQASPLRRARLGAVVETSVLLSLCLVIVPLMAIVVAADLYLLSNRSVVLTWASVLLTLGLGYGALAAILARGGRPVLYPRRAIRRTRAVVAELGALHEHQSRPGQ